MTQHNRPQDHLRHDRQDRLLREFEHDPYHGKRKIKGPAHCPGCGAVYTAGRWMWGNPERESSEHLCPACQRIRDGVPAAFVSLAGEFVRAHATEINQLIHNYVQREAAEHPLKRLMGEEQQGDTTVLTFTDAHLARGIGEALHHAYQGELKYHHEKGEVLLRVHWSR